MFGLKIVAALAALGMHPFLSQPEGQGVSSPLHRDSAMLADALSGPTLQLTVRGTSVTVLANATPAEGGCAARITARAPDGNQEWSRLFRWSELAWSGVRADGSAGLAFFEQEGHLPVDRLDFNPDDAAAFTSALVRVAEGCRAPRAETERVMIASKVAQPGCYFARHPGLRLAEGAAPYPARAMLTVLARETPDAELQLFFEREVTNGGDSWGAPWIDFTFADDRLAQVPVAKVAFAIDGRALAVQHSIANYGDTRLRIRIAQVQSPSDPARAGIFRQRLAAGKEVRLTLFDSTGRIRSVVHFDTGAQLAPARAAMSATGSSCADAAPAPAMASKWQPERRIVLAANR